MINIGERKVFDNEDHIECQNGTCNKLAEFYVCCSGDAFNGNYGWTVYACESCIKKYTCYSHFD